jgi:glycosyltransferase involved in cell wall biosynthesis
MFPALFALAMGIIALILLIRDALTLQRLPQISPQPLPAAPPLVNVIIPARNEEHNIATVLDGVLRQTYPTFTVTVLNDHSSDATGAVLAEYAQADRRLQVLNGADLPPGWMGKCWACWQAANATAGEWLLFLDADTKPQPEMIAATIAHATHHNLDLVTLMPFMELGTFWEKAILPAFLSMIQAAFPVEKINTPGSGVVLANGQFILVRRTAYQRAGGHQAVHDRVLEDVELAQAVVRSGGQMQAVSGHDLLRVRMYTSGAEVREGLTKNAIAGLRNGGRRSTWAGVRQILVALVPPALIVGAVWANLRQWPRRPRLIVNATTLTVNAFAAWSWGRFMRRLYHLPRRAALLFPLGLLCYMLIAADAAWRIWRGHGVSWKGRQYEYKNKV